MDTPLKLINLDLKDIDKTYKDLIKDIIIVFVYAVFIVTVYLSLNIEKITWRELLFFLLLLVLFHRLIGSYIINIA
jgi:hypothetical protein